MSKDRQELVLLLREVMRWEKAATSEKPSTIIPKDNRGDDYLNGEVTVTGKSRNDGRDAWDDLADILNRAHVAISTDSRERSRQRLQGRC